jgi:hypothetical protein
MNLLRPLVWNYVYSCICTCTNTYLYIFISMHMYICVRIQLWMHTCMSVRKRDMRVCLYVCKYIQIHLNMCNELFFNPVLLIYYNLFLSFSRMMMRLWSMVRGSLWRVMITRYNLLESMICKYDCIHVYIRTYMYRYRYMYIYIFMYKGRDSR